MIAEHFLSWKWRTLCYGKICMRKWWPLTLMHLRKKRRSKRRLQSYATCRSADSFQSLYDYPAGATLDAKYRVSTVEHLDLTIIHAYRPSALCTNIKSGNASVCLFLTHTYAHTLTHTHIHIHSFNHEFIDCVSLWYDLCNWLGINYWVNYVFHFVTFAID